MKNMKYKDRKQLKRYSITLTTVFETGRNNDMMESNINDVVSATDLIDAHSKAVEIAHKINAVNNAYNYEVSNISPYGEEY